MQASVPSHWFSVGTSHTISRSVSHALQVSPAQPQGRHVKGCMQVASSTTIVKKEEEEKTQIKDLKLSRRTVILPYTDTLWDRIRLRPSYCCDVCAAKCLTARVQQHGDFRNLPA